MALWPFGRHKKRARKGDDETYAVPVDHHQRLASTTATSAAAPVGSIFTSPSGRPQTPPAQTANISGVGSAGPSTGKLVRRDSKRQKYSSAPPQTQSRHASSFVFHRSSPAAATVSTAAGPSSTFSSSRVDSPMTVPDGRALRQPTSVDTFASVHALSPSKTRTASRMTSQTAENGAYLVPTLHGKRTATEPSILRRRSDRRRRNDPEREREIKRMASLVWDPRRNVKDASKAADRNHSDPFTSYSGPLAPEPAESHTFKLSAFNALSPRPFLRYGEGNRASLPPFTTGLSRSSTTKEKGKSRWFSADHATIMNSSKDHNMRIEELADTMDASALRELMDRDRRRRLVKRQILREQQQAATVRQRPAVIENRAPPARNDEHQASSNPAEVPPSPDRMDISTTPNQSESWLRDASKESLVKEEQHDSLVIPDMKENIIPRASSPHTVISRNGQTLELDIPPGEQRDEIPDISQHPAFRHPSVSEKSSMKPPSSSTHNETKLGRTWTQIFRRRGTLRNKLNATPRNNNSSEFSVVSRDSRSRLSQQYQPAAAPPPFQRTVTDTQSIQSKFTEHLDDVSVGIPQATRMYSADTSSNMNRDDAYSTSNRMSGAEMYSISGMSTGANAPGPDTRPNSTFLAQSLASIDSEGSWLSGRPSRRLSNAPLKSPGSTRERLDDMLEPEGEEEDNGVSSDEYFGTLPVPKEEEEEAEEIAGRFEADTQADLNPTTMNGHLEPVDAVTVVPEGAADGMKLANAHGDPPTWHSSVGKRARLISPETRAKSREGLFTEFIDSENEVSPIEEAEPEIRRAQSIDMGRHVRHISAGSAKLVTLKRYSAASASSMGVLPTKTEEEI